MILKHFYDEEDYQVVMRMLWGMKMPQEDIERVRTRLMFLKGIEDKK